jgi:hypothetical protein
LANAFSPIPAACCMPHAVWHCGVGCRCCWHFHNFDYLEVSGVFKGEEECRGVMTWWHDNCKISYACCIGLSLTKMKCISKEAFLDSPEGGLDAFQALHTGLPPRDIRLPRLKTIDRKAFKVALALIGHVPW